MKVLCVTHASRPFVEARTSLNGLESRFSAVGRLEALPSWETLGGVDSAVPFSGSLTLWQLHEEDEPRLTFLRAYDPGYKVQSAVFAGDRLLVCGSDRLEVLDTSLQVVKTIEDNWICGGHTVFVDGDGFAWLTSAPANAILRVDVESGTVVERIRLPPRYGVGYDIGPQHDLRRHFVPTDRQPTHVNCAYPTAEGVLVTLFIPGVVGRYGRDRQYREIVSGIRGCHGGKLSPSGDELYLTDSPAGLVWFFDPRSGAVRGRLNIGSAWLHDSHMINDRLLAVGLSDRNEVRLVERSSGRCVLRQACAPFGASVMFVACSEVAEGWSAALPPPRVSPTAAEAELGPELLRPVTDPPYWTGTGNANAEIMARLRVRCPSCTSEYLATGTRLWLEPGRYRFSGGVSVDRGGFGIGISDVAAQTWLAQLRFDAVASEDHAEFVLSSATETQVIMYGHNPLGPGPVSAEVVALSLRPVAGTVEEEPVLEKKVKRIFPALTSARKLRHLWNLLELSPMRWALLRGPADKVDTKLAIQGRAMPDESLVVGPKLSLPAGDYLLDLRIACRRGGVALGLFDKKRKAWHGPYRFDAATQHLRPRLSLTEKAVLTPVLMANLAAQLPFEAVIDEISVRRIIRP